MNVALGSKNNKKGASSPGRVIVSTASEVKMELKELYTKTLEIFNVSDAGSLGDALMECINKNDTEKMYEFENLVEGDLTKDWLQMIYQYYCADRKEKKQDYTPKCLADFMGRLVGNADTVIDLCAGSGALTIQKWVQNKNQKFRLYEIDKNVIPYLLFNCAIRNITASVCRADAIKDEVYEQWFVRKGEKYGIVTCVQSAV